MAHSPGMVSNTELSCVGGLTAICCRAVDGAWYGAGRIRSLSSRPRQLQRHVMPHPLPGGAVLLPSVPCFSFCLCLTGIQASVGSSCSPGWTFQPLSSDMIPSAGCSFWIFPSCPSREAAACFSAYNDSLTPPWPASLPALPSLLLRPGRAASWGSLTFRKRS